MNPGKLRQRLIFQKPSEGKTVNGFPTGSPTIYLTANAALKTLKGSTFYAAASSNMESNRQFTIRYRKELMDGVRPKGLEVLWRDIVHEIASIENDDGLNKTMTVFLKAVR